ncbi:lipoyl(octanoyl) transferase LipB [Fastidiosibacter lacustris]|uniref:lipoyl(octanoyl) transferase LipB n=1 Tax=Fastidiosibacter lacustris TaxID=2056695 RepID=UPI000E354525|nr:lipoyl(octanoyl) transferase LipB [Fastidiosibacter lacustris]
MPALIKELGLTVYDKVYQAMVDFTKNRGLNTTDELWLLEHPSVFTQGRHGKAEHLINPHHIPVIQTDRGGQITYHGPGQAVIYFLFDLKRLGVGVKDFVCHIEKTCITLLKQYGIKAHTIANAPGIYVNNTKIASLGLRIKKGLTYHGIAINTNMDLTPFSYINPCGYKNLKMTQISDYVPDIDTKIVLSDYAMLMIRD